MMLQLNPPIPLKTPKGDAWATAIVDYGPQWDILWITFVEATGECWTFKNPEVRQGRNYTFAHPDPTPIKPRDEAPKQEVVFSKQDAPLPSDLDFSVAPVVTKKNGYVNGHNGTHS